MKAFNTVILAFFLGGCGEYKEKVSKQQEWIDAAARIAAVTETKLSGNFLKTKSIKWIDEFAFKSFDADTLFIKFDHEKSVDYLVRYVDGVLYITGTRINYSDTGKALSLMYGIASHVIQSQSVQYGSAGEKENIDKARAEQYIFDVMQKIGGKKYEQALVKESQRQYKNRASYVIADTVFVLFKHSMKEDELEWMDVNFQKAAGFRNCDIAYGDTPQSWACKVFIRDEIELENFVPVQN